MFCKRYRIHHKNDYNKQGTPCIVVAIKIIFFIFNVLGVPTQARRAATSAEAGAKAECWTAWFLAGFKPAKKPPI